MSLYNLAREKHSNTISTLELYKTADTSAQYTGINIEEMEETLPESEEITKAKLETEPPVTAAAKPSVSVSRQLTDEQRSYLNQLTKYIPTESITLYVAGMSLLPMLKDEFPFFSSYLFYWLFAALTPIILWSFDFGQYRKSKQLGSTDKYKLPLWNITASLIAFLCWALAVPNSPYLTTAAGGALAAFLAVFISTGLGIVEKNFIK